MPLPLFVTIANIITINITIIVILIIILFMPFFSSFQNLPNFLLHTREFAAFNAICISCAVTLSCGDLCYVWDNNDCIYQRFFFWLFHFFFFSKTLFGISSTNGLLGRWRGSADWLLSSALRTVIGCYCLISINRVRWLADIVRTSIIGWFECVSGSSKRWRFDHGGSGEVNSFILLPFATPLLCCREEKVILIS